VPFILFAMFGGIGFGLFSMLAGGTVGGTALAASLFLGLIVASSIKVAAEWEKGLVFRLGKYHAQRGPGLFAVLPFFDSVKKVDTRIRTLEIPHRQAITKDNVPVRIDGVIFMRVDDPASAIIRVQNFEEAVQEYAQTALRDIVGSTSLDDILADREALGRKVEEMVETEIDGWGIEVAGIRIQDIELPEDLKRVMARQASAEREKRATITKAEGDRDAAANLAQAARTMASASGALQLRTLQTLDGLGSSPSNTVVLAVPTEVFEALRSIPGMAKALETKE
jgi:regulator of protease activity HflC (stomatin/prohibitin superfamily)